MPRYKVGIRKEYFPQELWPTEFGRSYVETFAVLAGSRREAADKVWARHGKRLLAKMVPANRTRRISLDVNSPMVRSIGRLHPVIVFEGSDVIGPRLLQLGGPGVLSPRLPQGESCPQCGNRDNVDVAHCGTQTAVLKCRACGYTP